MRSAQPIFRVQQMVAMVLKRFEGYDASATRFLAFNDTCESRLRNVNQ